MAAAASWSSMRTDRPSASGRPVATAMNGILAARSASSAMLESDNGGGRMMPPTPSPQQALDRRALVAGATLFQHDLTAGVAALLQDTDQQLVQIGRAGVVVQKTDMERGRPRQVARRDVRRIAELFDRGLHPLAHVRLYVGIATQRARDGHGRNTGVFRDFMHRHCITAPSGRSFHF